MSYYLASGYSMIDHQLDPLLEVAAQWINDAYNPQQTPQDKQETAELIAQALESAAQYVRSLGTPAEPLDSECDRCGAPAGQMCWNPRYYNDNKHPHAERRAAVKGTTKAEWNV